MYFANQSLQRANLRSADGQCIYSPGWPGSFVMDPFDPDYLNLLEREAHRHVAMLGEDFAGVSCDRGWAQLNNAHADDGITYCAGSAQCRSLLYSQRHAMARVGQIFHDAGKIISYNPIQIPRVDIMEHYDTIFTELGLDAGGRTRLVSAMALQKPATMWVTHQPSDAAFGFALLHGVYPMAPAPSGDHSLGMSGMSAFMNYGPMLRALQGRVWNLQPHAISATVTADGPDRDAATDAAAGGGGGGSALATGVDANLFDLPDGSSVAVLLLHGGVTKATVAVKLKKAAATAAEISGSTAIVESLQVGRKSEWTAAKASGDGTVHLDIESSIAMLRVRVD